MDINGKTVDMDQLGTMTLGDFEDLQKAGVDPKRLESDDLNFSEIISFIYYFANKANGEVTRDDIRALSIDRMQEVSSAISDNVGGRGLPEDPS